MYCVCVNVDLRDHYERISRQEREKRMSRLTYLQRSLEFGIGGDARLLHEEALLFNCRRRK